MTIKGNFPPPPKRRRGISSLTFGIILGATIMTAIIITLAAITGYSN